MNEPFAILVVCSANICRSPYAQVLLQQWVADSGRDREVAVRSAGVAAYPGDPMCAHAAAQLGIDPFVHAAQELTPGLLIDADLVITADRSLRGAAARLSPSCRPRLFTLRQAGALGMAIAVPLVADTLPEGAPPLPGGPVERLEWLVRELDAARGLLAARPEGDADIVDRHGPAPHSDTFAQVATSVGYLTAAFDACLQRT